MPYNPHAMSRSALRRQRPVPAIDERLVAPESGAEILDGRVVMSPPCADPPHAMRHLTLAYLLGAHVAPGYTAAIDMLTRTDLTSDFAPDASVFPVGADPETGGRRLEVLAFEIVSKQRLSVARTKARKLAARGVERVFALSLKSNRAVEWDRKTREFRAMRLDETIEHRALASALPIAALLETAQADEAVLSALEVRRPDLVERLEARGEARGERRAIELACSLLEIPIDEARRGQLETASLEELRRLSEALSSTRRWPRPRRRR